MASDGSPTLLGLHQDLLVKVLLQLEPRDLQSVSNSCKALALTDSPLWQSLFFHKWDVPRGSHLNYKKLYFREGAVASVFGIRMQSAEARGRTQSANAARRAQYTRRRKICNTVPK